MTDIWPPVESTNMARVNANFDTPCNYIVSKKQLGHGSFSTVYECKNKITGSHYAAKLYSKRLVFGLEETLQSEFHVLKKISMSHPNILTLVDYFESKGCLYLVTDLAAGGELFDKIVESPESKLDESQAQEITRTLVSTIAYLHSNHIVHRDLKAENLLFQSKSAHNNEILVADFGLARVLESESARVYDVSGTLSYMAPEMFDRENGHGFAVDIWAIGVIVYFMLCGYMPFDCETDDETKEAINKADYHYAPPEYWDHISADAKDFIDSCFKVNPEERIKAQDLLHHPFIHVPHAQHLQVPHPLHAVNNRHLTRNSASNLSLKKLQESVMLLQQKQNGSSMRELLMQKGSKSPTRPPSYYENKSYASFTSLPISSLSSKLSLLEKSRSNALVDGTTLKGACCESPDQVSQFNTPISSAAVSRQHSNNDMLDFTAKKTLDMAMSKSENDAAPSAKFFF